MTKCGFNVLWIFSHDGDPAAAPDERALTRCRMTPCEC